MALTLLVGCYTSRTTAGPFVTDIHVDGPTVSVTRCELVHTELHRELGIVVAVALLVPLVVLAIALGGGSGLGGGGGEGSPPRSDHEITVERCSVATTALPGAST